MDSLFFLFVAGTCLSGFRGMDGFPVTLTEAVCLGASLAFSGLFYYLYKKNKTTVKKLEVCIFYVT